MQPNVDSPPKKTRPTGAGRKVGSLNKATQLRLAGCDDALSAGVLPLAVMLQRMRSLLRAGDEAAAFFCAVQAAPYCHARLSAVAVDQTVRLDPGELSDSQLASIIANGPAGKRKPVAIEHAPALANGLAELETFAKTVATENEGNGG